MTTTEQKGKPIPPSGKPAQPATQQAKPINPGQKPQQQTTPPGKNPKGCC